MTLLEDIIPIVVGAGASALLIPFFTSIWQTHQKGLEIRIDLVKRISQTVMGTMIMIKSGEVKPTEELLDKEYRKYLTDQLRDFHLDQEFSVGLNPSQM